MEINMGAIGYKDPSEKTPNKHAEIIKAWADGAQIQYKQTEFGGYRWLDVSHPSWIDSTEYRIKPEPKPDVVITDCIVPNRFGWNSIENCDGQDNVKFIFDGETGKLKDVKIIK